MARGSQLKAVSRVCRAWGVTDGDKIMAVRIIQTRRVKPYKVVAAVEKIAKALGALHNMAGNAGLLKAK